MLLWASIAVKFFWDHSYLWVALGALLRPQNFPGTTLKVVSISSPTTKLNANRLCWHNSRHWASTQTGPFSPACENVGMPWWTTMELSRCPLSRFWRQAKQLQTKPLQTKRLSRRYAPALQLYFFVLPFAGLALRSVSHARLV